MRSELHRIHDGIKVQVIAELEEIVAQRRDVHARRNADRDLRGKHVGTGLHGAIARAAEVLDGDVLAVEEIRQLKQDAGFVGGDHFDDVGKQIALQCLGASAVPGETQTVLALKPGQRRFQLGYGVPGSYRECKHGDIAPDRREARIDQIAAAVGYASADCQQRRVGVRTEGADEQVVFVGGRTGWLFGQCRVFLRSRRLNGRLEPDCRILATDSGPQVTSAPVSWNPSPLHLSGSITALATPFRTEGALDIAAWKRLLSLQLAGGTQAVVVAGSTGEAAALSLQEFMELLSIARDSLPADMPVIAGTGQSATAATIERTRCALEAGADAALVVTPPYVRPTQAGLVAHYRAVAAEGGLPVVLYNVPSRTGCDLLPETCAQLAGLDGIIGIKEAVADVERMHALLDLRGNGFVVLSGDDPTASRAMLAGADGLISVASNVAPRAVRRLCDLSRGGDAAAAAALDKRLAELFGYLGVEPNPIPAKAMLAALGLCKDVLRLPLLALSESQREHCARIAVTLAHLEAELQAAA